MQVCKFFVRGFCARGDTCCFVHPVLHYMDLELQTDIANSASTLRPEAEAFTPAQSVSVVCRFFLHGRCRYGDLCEFLHDDRQVKKILQSDSAHVSLSLRP